LKGAARAYVRNNLVTGSGEWGIHVDNGDPPAPPAIDGNVVAFTPSTETVTPLRARAHPLPERDRRDPR